MHGVIVKAILLAVLALHHPAHHHVTVKPGQSLSVIAAARCGSSADWTGIYARNRKVIGRDPNLIVAGQRLAITCRQVPQLAALAAPPPPPPAPPATVVSDPAPAPPAPPAPVPPTAGAGSYAAPPGSFQQCVIQAESGGDPSAVNPSSGAGGLYGFLPSTWAALGFPGLPENAPVAMQNAAFAKEYAQSGTSAWSAYDGC